MFLVQAALSRSEAASEVGIAVALLKLMGVGGLIFIVLTQLRIQTLNFYLSSINIQRLVRDITGWRVWRKLVIVFVAVVAVLLMLTDVFSYLQTTLQYLGIFFVGWAGIMSTCVALGGMPANFGPGTESTARRWLTPATVVWLVSAGVGIALQESGQQLPTLSQIASVVALGVAVVGYLPILLWQRHRTSAGTESGSIPSQLSAFG
jgi:membrane protein YdbS with pleckstrin-like domain